MVRKDPLSNHFDIKYAASVHKNKKEYVIEVKDYDGIYHLNLGSNPKLAKKFDKFCEITEKNEAQIENYDKLYLEKDDEKIDYPSAVDYIKKARKSNGKHLAFLVSLFSTGVLSCALGCDVLLYDYSSIVANGALLPAAIICGGAVLLGAPIAVFATNFIQNPHDNFFTKIAKTFKFDRYLSRQAERAKRIANSAEKTKKMYSSEMPETYQPKDVYSDGVIEYISNIKNAAVKLDKDDRDEILSELMEILSDYTKKCKKFNSSDNKGLTLENSKEAIVAEAIDKLTRLQFKVADIMKGNKKNKTLTMESDKLMNELKELTAGDTEEEKQVVARGSR